MNEKMKHTPGPWRHGKKEGGAFTLWYITPVAESQSDVSQVQVLMDTRRTIAEHEANARLIAAAPELLEALELLERVIDGPIADLLTGDSMSSTGAYTSLQIARAAIAKARGEKGGGL